MCLRSSSCQASYADRDITCYKLVYPENMDHKFRSQFREFPYELGRTYHETRFEKVNPSYCIYRGYHSYRTIDETVSHARPGMVMIKCVIPEGSWYYVSENRDQYCSDKIKPVAWRGVWGGKWQEKTGK